MFGWEYPPWRSGGLATATAGLVKGLLARGMEVTLVVPFSISGSAEPRLSLRSAARPPSRLRRVRVRTPVGPYGGAEEYVLAHREATRGTSGAAIYGADLMEEVERLAAVAGEFARSEPHDVIHVHDWITYRAGIEARRVSGRPVVAHIHATEYDRAGEGADPEIAGREREGLLAADRVIANSHALKRQIVSRYGIPATRVDVVHWGIDPDGPTWDGGTPSPLPPDTPVVLFLGRVTRQKGPDHFVELARRVADHVPEARFVIAGTGDLLPRVLERAVELGLAERVLFAGPLEGSEVHRAFRMARVCVMPSVSEPFGLVALESLRAGTPCLVPRGSGASEVLRHALAVDFWDLEEMTNKVVAILRHPQLREELSVRGSAEVRSRRFSLEEAARGTEAAYRAVLSPGGAA